MCQYLTPVIKTREHQYPEHAHIKVKSVIYVHPGHVGQVRSGAQVISAQYLITEGFIIQHELPLSMKFVVLHAPPTNLFAEVSRHCDIIRV